jgi:glyoxylase-like metal-dependent hydrolase (beta-lactamase superfamily II)
MTGPGTNTFLIGTGDRPILLDTGAGIARYVELLQRTLRSECQADQPGDIVTTHAHPDHMGGVADVVSHFEEQPVAKLPWPGKDENFLVKIRPLADGDLIQTTGAALQAVHTPGHSPDHICYYLEEERALFTGDVILGAGTSVIPIDGGDMTQYLATLERILELELERIYPGHGPPIPNPREKVQAYIRHRKERESQILQAIKSGASSVEQIVTIAYQDTPQVLHLAAAQSAFSHLRKLERERRAARAVDPSGADHWSLA